MEARYVRLGETDAESVKGNRERNMAIQTVATEDHHPTAWFTGMKQREKNTFWACFGGWVLDAMDVQMFSFVIPAIIAVFAITNADAGLIGTATLLTSAFGGWIAGALADRFGRVRTLQITISVVRGVHLSLRLRAELHAVVRLARADGARLRRRMGRRRRADRRSDPRRTSRQGGGHHAKRLGDRLGHRRAAGDRVLHVLPAGDGLACVVLGRPHARLAGLFRAPVRRRAAEYSTKTQKNLASAGEKANFWKFFRRQC